MSFDKFKKYSGSDYADQSGDDKPKNPYVTKKYDVKKSPPIDNNPPSGGEDKMYMTSKILQLEREIKDLRQDIATLVTILEDNYERKMTKEAARDIYFKFRANPSHLENRLTDKNNGK